MKRVRETGDGGRSPSPFPLDNNPMTVPEGRTSINGTDLDSLEDPLPQGGSFMAALKSDRRLGYVGAEPCDSYAAIQELICRLDEEDHPHQSDPEIRHDAVCTQAAQLLMQHGQARLLLRLAQKSNVPYCLFVDADEERAAVLARIGSAWPKQVPVCIYLDLELGAHAISALSSFLSQPERLELSLYGYGEGDSLNDELEAEAEDEALAVQRALSQRKVDKLMLSGAGILVAHVQALQGVAAHVIDLGGVEWGDSDIQQVADALVAMVSASGAVELLMARHIGTNPVALRLLACRSVWERVAINDAPLLDALATQAPCQIRQLVWKLWDRAGFEITPARLQTLHQLGVHTLEFSNPVNVLHFVEAMEVWAQKVGKEEFAHTVRGNFRLPAHPWSIERLVAVHRYLRRCQVLEHRPLRMDEIAQGQIPELDADTIARLNAINGFQVGEGVAERAAHVEQVWTQAVQDIVGLLGSDKPLSALMDYLMAPPWVLRVVQTSRDADGVRAPLSAKLLQLKRGGLPPERLRSALQQALRADPTCLALLPRALFESGWILRPSSSDAWRGWGRQHAFTPFVQRASVPEAPEVLPLLAAPSSQGSPDRYVPSFSVLPIVPAGGWTAQQTFDACRGRIQRYLAQNLAPHIRAALAVLAEIFDTGAVRTSLLKSASVAEAVLQTLGHWGQGGLARHIIAGAPVWPLRIRESKYSKVLPALTPWPDPTSRCGLIVSTSAGALVIPTVRELALTVPRAKLVLALEMDASCDDWFAAGWESLVKGCAGASLELGVQASFKPQAQDWLVMQRLLAAVEKYERSSEVPERELSLGGWPEVPEAVALAALGALDRGGFSRLSLFRIHQPLAQRLVSARGWDRLWIEPSIDMVDCFQGGDVRARTLRFHVRQERTWDHIVSIVGACKGLKAIEIQGGAVNILQLAALVRDTRSLTSVTCDLVADSPQEIQDAKRLLEGNRRITTFDQDKEIDANGASAGGVGEVVWAWLHGLANRNRLLEPEPIGHGLVRGMSLAQGSTFPLPVEVADGIGGYVDLGTALNLMYTSKSMYAGARHAIDAWIDRLADLLSDRVGFQQYLATMDQHFYRDRPMGGPTDAALFLRAKLSDMLTLGIPQGAVQQVVGRRLAWLTSLPKEDQGAAAVEHERWELLQCLAALGEIQAEVWVETGLGIRVEPVTTKAALPGAQ